MVKNKFFLSLLVSIFLSGCNTFKPGTAPPAQTPKPPVVMEQPVKKPIEPLPDVTVKTDKFLSGLVEKNEDFFKDILQNSKALNVQVIYTKIDRDANNNPKLTDYYFNVSRKHYYYPASTVKLSVVLLSLERLNELREKSINKNTTMITEAAYSGQTEVLNDPATPDGKPTIANYIKKILLTSDNDAFNRLYEFLGQQYINEQLRKKDYTDAEIIHRLDIFLSEDENRHTNPVKFLSANGEVVYTQPLVFNQQKHLARNDFLGNGFYKDGQLVNSPMNFSKKNRLALEDLHHILRSLIFPASVPPNQRFNLSADDYKMMYQYMSQYPSETIYPAYDTSVYYDAYVKFLLNGNRKESMPKNIRIFNKVGDAYGEMIDAAYVADFDHKIEFFLSAAIDCNVDGIINDDNYAYDSVGFPFMKNIGQVIYDYELNRPREYVPDLSQFKIAYDR